MLAGHEVDPERLVFSKSQYRFKAAVSRSCFVLGESQEDIDSLRVAAKPPPDAAIHITKELTQARTALGFVLPFRLQSKAEQIRLQYRYMPAQGQLGSVTSLLAADDSGKTTTCAQTAPAHTSAWQGQITVSAHHRIFADLAPGHDRLVWTIELETDRASCDLIDVSISVGDCWVVFKGNELLRGGSAVDASEMPAGDDLAGLIRSFETQYDAWGRMRLALADEIDYLRRSLDEACLKPGVGSTPVD